MTNRTIDIKCSGCGTYLYSLHPRAEIKDDYCATCRPKAMIRENRYIVIKRTDAQKALSTEQLATLSDLTNKVAMGRCINGKAPLECVVIESDWPEYEPTWKAIEERVASQEKK